MAASRMSKRFTGFLGRSKSTAQPGSSADDSREVEIAPTDARESNIGRNIRLFCESGSTSNGGEEVLYLPAIVDEAEASPTAAAGAARQIRIFLSREWAVKPHVQYNAIMLIRILADNPGASFTKNFDKEFVSTVKEALKMCKDSSTQQILRETLDTLEVNKIHQDGMEGLIAMWRKQKGRDASFVPPNSYQPLARGSQNDYAYWRPSMNLDQQPGPGDRRQGSRRQLPPPVELASRIEEARNTAKILLQLIQSTPSEEVLHNELMREFAERCQSAQKSMAGYISCDTPPPDDETMLTLIETNEQLSLAASRYQRSVLNSRKALGVSPSPNAEAMQNSAAPVTKSTVVPPSQEQSLFAASGPRSAPKSPPPAGVGVGAFGNAGANESFQAPLGPPLRQTTQPRGLPNYEETFSPPLGPPPRQSTQQSQLTGRNGSYSPPPSPPTAMLARLNSRERQTSSNRFEPKQVSDPFADPAEHDVNPAPLAIDTRTPVALQDSANRGYANTYSVDGGQTYAPGNVQRSPDDDDDQYNSSPVQTRVSPMSYEQVSPVSPSQRRWQDLRATASYMGRQTSAADGLTMHGARADQDVAEIDGYSNVGRTAQPAILRNDTNESDAASSAYSVTPSQARA